MQTRAYINSRPRPEHLHCGHPLDPNLDITTTSHFHSADTSHNSPAETMSAIPKTFWSSPIRYLKWASYEKPAIFYSVILGCMGPVAIVAIPPLRRLAGDENPPLVPLTYPSKWTEVIELAWRRDIRVLCDALNEC